jgi:hypothetical protein
MVDPVAKAKGVLVTNVLQLALRKREKLVKLRCNAPILFRKALALQALMKLAQLPPPVKAGTPGYPMPAQC